MSSSPPGRDSPRLQQLTQLLEALDDYETEASSVSPEERSLLRSAEMLWRELTPAECYAWKHR